MNRVIPDVRKFGICAAAVTSLFLFAACGSDDDEDDFTPSSRVTDVGAEDTSIRVGDGTVTHVEFTYDADDVFDGDEAVVIVVRLPPELRYRDDTSEVDTIGGDKKVGARITSCPSGETFLTYVLDRFDLDGAENPDGDADARFTFTMDAVGSTGAAVISARGDNEDITFDCAVPFNADRSETIIIIP